MFSTSIPAFRRLSTSATSASHGGVPSRRVPTLPFFFSTSVRPFEASMVWP